MILENMDFDSFKDYLHMERYVNTGSPSGFTEKYTTSPHTSAKGSSDEFYLCSVDFPDNLTFQDFGHEPEFFSWKMLVHPDMIDDELFSVCSKVNKEAVLVAPTASSRTVKIIDKDGWFLKLNYKGLIGRADRQIGRNQALSAIEVSNIIAEAIEVGKLPNTFFFLRELFARVVKIPVNNSFYEWGIVLREPRPYPKNDEIKYIIPAFSLFSKDDKSPSDPTILTQLIKKQDKTVEDFLFEDIISPVYEAYFNILIRCGLQLECHAQNTSFAIDKYFRIVGVVAKDAESIDKDLSLMNELKLKNEISTMKYKCLSKGDYNYEIMHSFMFDFKLGEYLIIPLIEDAFKNYSFNKTELIDRIKKYNNTFIKQLPNNFFPKDGKWYSYENIVHDITKKRPYIANDNPMFR